MNDPLTMHSPQTFTQLDCVYDYVKTNRFIYYFMVKNYAGTTNESGLNTVIISGTELLIALNNTPGRTSKHNTKCKWQQPANATYG